MKKKYIFILIFIGIFGCKDNLNEPIEDIPGSSNYIWQVDTLDVELGHSLSRIYGSSADDIWVCGDGEVWHYSNSKWIKDNSVLGYGWGSLGGTDQSNIWMAANGNYDGIDIYHFNGNMWKEFGHYEYEKVDSYLWLNDIIGISPKSVYGVGAIETKTFSKNIGIVMHFDGQKWSVLDLPKYDLVFDGIRRDGNGKYYIYGEHWSRDTTTNPITITDILYQIYEFDGENLTEILSRRKYYIYPTTINGTVYFIGKNTVQKYNNNNFEIIYDFTGSEYTIQNGIGSNLKDMIFWCVKGNDYYGTKYLVHFNGTELVEIFSEEEYIFSPTIIDERIFAIIQTKDYKWAIAKGVVKQ